MAFWVDSFAGGFSGHGSLTRWRRNAVKRVTVLTYLSYGTEALPAALRSRPCVVLEAHEYPVAFLSRLATHLYLRAASFSLTIGLKPSPSECEMLEVFVTRALLG